MSELKPCPFCGESDLTTETDDGIYWVICKVCFAEGPYLSIRADETAVDWNTRAEPTVKPCPTPNEAAGEDEFSPAYNARLVQHELENGADLIIYRRGKANWIIPNSEGALEVWNTRTAQKEVVALQATLQALRGQAYAATNPANRKNESVEDRCAFYEKTLDEIADQNHEIDILERQYEWYMAEIEKARAAPKVDTIRAKDLSDQLKAECSFPMMPNHGELAPRREVIMWEVITFLSALAQETET